MLAQKVNNLPVKNTETFLSGWCSSRISTKLVDRRFDKDAQALFILRFNSYESMFDRHDEFKSDLVAYFISEVWLKHRATLCI